MSLFPIQYSSAKDGSALGVTVTRSALLTHCRSLTTACLYREGMFCTDACIDVHVLCSLPVPVECPLGGDLHESSRSLSCTNPRGNHPSVLSGTLLDN